jgi:uncharacterized OB-fold protein
VAAKCASCGSTQVSHEPQAIFCFKCGAKTGYDGRKIERLVKKPAPAK